MPPSGRAPVLTPSHPVPSMRPPSGQSGSQLPSTRPLGGRHFDPPSALAAPSPEQAMASLIQHRRRVSGTRPPSWPEHRRRVPGTRPPSWRYHRPARTVRGVPGTTPPRRRYHGSLWNWGSCRFCGRVIETKPVPGTRPPGGCESAKGYMSQASSPWAGITAVTHRLLRCGFHLSEDPPGGAGHPRVPRVLGTRPPGWRCRYYSDFSMELLHLSQGTRPPGGP